MTHLDDMSKPEPIIWPSQDNECVNWLKLLLVLRSAPPQSTSREKMMNENADTVSKEERVQMLGRQLSTPTTVTAHTQMCLMSSAMIYNLQIHQLISHSLISIINRKYLFFFKPTLD